MVRRTDNQAYGRVNIMGQNELIAVCLSIVFVFLYIPGIFFLFGKGGLSIGGYHYTASSEKGKYFHKIILRRAGVFYIILIGLIHACILTGILGKPVACYTLIPITVVWVVAGILYFNLSKKIRFARRQEKFFDEEERNDKIKDDMKENIDDI